MIILPPSVSTLSPAPHIMRCPVCKIDLSPLDLASKNEHIEDCLENGPTILDVNESGEVVRKKNLPLNRQRKICPICDKTFQTIHTHYKACALKNDLPPQLMLDHWDKLNADSKLSKRFPRELLDNFIAKSIKEGRVGEQVDYAKALLLSMFNGEPTSKRHRGNTVRQQPNVNITLDEDTSQSCTSTISSNQQVTQGGSLIESNTLQYLQAPLASTSSSLEADQISMQNNEASSSSATSATSRRRKETKRYPLELMDAETKAHNIQLRIEREIAASQKRRYLESLSALGMKEDVVEGSLTQEVELGQ